jgi:hypothetical protein
MFPELERLAADIESSSPGDPKAQRALHERILQLHAQLERAHAGDVSGYLDSAAEMVQYLVHMGRMGPDQVLRIAADMVRRVGDLLGRGGAPGEGHAPLALAPKGPQAPLPVAEAHLRGGAGAVEHGVGAPADERLLGEIMVQLGMVTKKQLEQALVRQRATDQRIGEALVGLGAAAWGQVEEAMAVQRRLRTLPSLPRPR